MCPNGITSIADKITNRCTARGRRTIRCPPSPTVTAGLPRDAYPDIHTYSSTLETLTRSACDRLVGVAMDSNHMERQCNSDLAVGRRPETAKASGIRNDLQLLTERAARFRSRLSHQAKRHDSGIDAVLGRPNISLHVLGAESHVIQDERTTSIGTRLLKRPDCSRDRSRCGALLSYRQRERIRIRSMSSMKFPLHAIH